MTYLRVSPEEPVQIEDAYGEPTWHVFDEDSIHAINAALAAERPLLVRGEPGTGKSQLARAAAHQLERRFLVKTIDARTEARDLHWTFDAVARLAKAQLLAALSSKLGPEEVESSLREELFVRPGVLWDAFDGLGAKLFPNDNDERRREEPELSPAVLLIDEIDKADSSVPNGLLEALGQGWFEGPGRRKVRAHGDPALVIITTNEERALPNAFLRRCLALKLAWPEVEQDLVDRLLPRGQAHFPDLDVTLLEEAALLVAEDRRRLRDRQLYAPGGAEYLDLLRAVRDLAQQLGEEPRAILTRVRRFVLDKNALPGGF
jgi:MoxR-like ATPase